MKFSRVAFAVATVLLVASLAAAVVIDEANVRAPWETRHDFGQRISRSEIYQRDVVPFTVTLDLPCLAEFEMQEDGHVSRRDEHLSKPRSVAHLDAIKAQQEAFAEELTARFGVDAQVVTRVQRVANSVTVMVPRQVRSEISSMAGVASVEKISVYYPELTDSPTHMNMDPLWKVTGREDAGRGVVLGHSDTGIWPEHPFFSDKDMEPSPVTGLPCQFNIGRRPGPEFQCNNKIVGARRDMFFYDLLIPAFPWEWSSARDDDGHGSHTASTAAGSLYNMPEGLASGVAPGAYIMTYKTLGALGGFGPDIQSAWEHALQDGVDTFTFSVGGPNDGIYGPESAAILRLFSANVPIAVSAGNSFPVNSAKAFPFFTSVAASNGARLAEGFIDIDDVRITGASSTADPSLTGPMKEGSTTLCVDPNPGYFDGHIAICPRGGFARVDICAGAAANGAIGCIFYNPEGTFGEVADPHVIPTVHISYENSIVLFEAIASHPGADATLSSQVTLISTDDRFMAGFSSQGPAIDSQLAPVPRLGGVLMPSVTGPGVDILAALQFEEADEPQNAAISGTSMSCPHIGGLFTALRSMYPDWSASDIQSAVTTRADLGSMPSQDPDFIATPHAYGSGYVNGGRAMTGRLSFRESAKTYSAYYENGRGSPADFNVASFEGAGVGEHSFVRTMTNIDDVDRSYTIEAIATPGFTLEKTPSIRPTQVTVAAGESVSFTVSFDIEEGDDYHGYIRIWANERGDASSDDYYLLPFAMFARASVFDCGLPLSGEFALTGSQSSATFFMGPYADGDCAGWTAWSEVPNTRIVMTTSYNFAQFDALHVIKGDPTDLDRTLLTSIEGGQGIQELELSGDKHYFKFFADSADEITAANGFFVHLAVKQYLEVRVDSCGFPVRMQVSGATPNGKVYIVAGSGTSMAPFSEPDLGCGSVDVPIGERIVVMAQVADRNGELNVSASPLDACGATVVVIDARRCHYGTV